MYTDKAMQIVTSNGLIPKITYLENFLDPLFWQTLGEGLGWENTNNCWGCSYDEGATIDTPIWIVKQHHFIDYLQEGKTAEDFFKDLLENKG